MILSGTPLALITVLALPGCDPDAKRGTVKLRQPKVVARLSDRTTAFAHGRRTRQGRSSATIGAVAMIMRANRADQPDRRDSFKADVEMRHGGADERDTLVAIQRAAAVHAYAHIYPPERYPL